MRNTLTIKVRLFSGLDKVVDVEGYDRNEGITLDIPEGVSIEFEKLEREFFNIVGWSYPSGGPTPGKMKELGIDSQ